MNEIPKCPKNLPYNITQTIRDLGKQWNLVVPKIKPDTIRKWDNLIDEWLNATDIPIIVRKGGKRGDEIRHEKTGRKIIISDNSPAQWVWSCAFIDVVPTIDDIPSLLINEIPIAMILKTVEKDADAKYKQTLKKKHNINIKGWKLCHKDPVGLKNRVNVPQIDIEKLEKSFLSFMKPSNLFLVPMEWGGLGELKEFQEEMK